MGIGKSVTRGFNLTGKSISQGIGFGEKNIVAVSVYLILATLIAIVGTIIGVVLGVGIPILFGDSIGMIGAMAVGTILAIIPIIIALSYSYAAQFGAIEFIYAKKRVPYFSRKNVSVAFRWTIFLLAVILIISASLGLLVAGMSLSPILGILAVMLFTLLILALIIVVSIIMYYVMQEMAVKKKGPWEAIGGSYKLIKSNFWETVVFAVILWVGAYLLQLIPGAVFYLVLNIGIVAAIVSPLFLGIVLVATILYIVVMIIISAAILIAKVGFYRELVTAPEVKTGKKVAKKTKPLAKKKTAA